MTTLEAKYQTPVGGFDTWEEAAEACERCDLDPCTCIVYVGGGKSPVADRPLYPFTIWEFRSVDGKQVVVSVRCSEPDDMKYQHEYQKILWRGQAFNKLDAYNRSAIKADGREIIPG